MKNVSNTTSSASRKSYSKRCAAVFSAVAITFTSLTFTVHYSAEAKAAEMSESFGSQKILELSESFLSLNTDKQVSVFQLAGRQTPESESVVFIEELSTGSESNVDVTKEETTEKVTEKVTEKETQTKAPETTTKAETTQASKPVVKKESGLYTFEELGLTQLSDIEVPENILFDENGTPLNYAKKITGRATAYHMGHTTATGTSVHPGVVAVNPRMIPYGSKMYIVADDGSVYGYCSAEDTGSFIYWNNAPTVDLYVESTNFAYQWGNKGVTIYIF